MVTRNNLATITAEQLEQMPGMDKRIELVRGEIVKMTPTGAEHGEIASAIGYYLYGFVREQGIGVVYAAETGFILGRDPDTVRAPDAAFVSLERASRQERPEGFFEGAPDLAVEVVSPSDRDQEVDEKTLDYLLAGTKLVWIIRPRTRTVTVYRSLKDIRILTTDDILDGGDVLPGFSLNVSEIFK